MASQKERVVAFLGPNTTYTQQVSSLTDISYSRQARYKTLAKEKLEQATTKQFPPSQYKLVPLTNIDDVFASVQGGDSSHGVVPFENSSNGSVVFTLDLFANLQTRYPDILVCGEIYLPVQHCILGHAPKGHQHPSKTESASREKSDDVESLSISGRVTPTQATPDPPKPRVTPIHDLQHISKLYSHPQAWGQCKLFLSTYVKTAERQDVSSTSKGAEQVAQDTTGTSAAIASKMSAELNELDVLAEGIEDIEGNSTRFFILRRRQDVPFVQESVHLSEAIEMERYKSLVSFTVSHSESGALADSLAVFKKFKLNLTSINTRPSGESPWHYTFLVEFMGRKRPEGEGGTINDALEALTRVARNWRWLGSWENQLKV